MNQTFFHRIFGEAAAVLGRSRRRIGWTDLIILVALAGVLYGVLDLAHEAAGEPIATERIDLSPLALPRYTFFSLCRGLAAYVLSLGFTLAYGYWAAKDKLAERVLIPMLDILQSIPVLGFLPGLLLALTALFPGSNIGIEMAAVIMIFTGQAWNMTFSFYHSVISVPLDQREVATIYRFNWWERFRWVELPFATMGLVWNSMMSMAGGWFFLMICETFQLGERGFRLDGLGSYMTCAVRAGRVDYILYAIGTMVAMIVLLDQLLWRPVVVWAQKFRVEEGGQVEEMTSWFLNWLRRSHILSAISHLMDRLGELREKKRLARAPERPVDPTRPSPWPSRIAFAIFLVLLALLLVGAYRLLGLLADVTPAAWKTLGWSAGLTLGRVLLSVIIGTLWAIPAGLAIGLSPRLSRALQPIVQVIASFPAPMLYTLVIAFLALDSPGALNWGSVLLMLLGTQWYILFNVISGAMAIPADLREAARSYRMRTWQQFWVLYLPAIFPFLVTGWVTAAGGAWNASIVSEYVQVRHAAESAEAEECMEGAADTITADGLGAEISKAAAAWDKGLPMLAASILTMSLVVVVFNRTVWRRCYRLAEGRFSLNR